MAKAKNPLLNTRISVSIVVGANDLAAREGRTSAAAF